MSAAPTIHLVPAAEYGPEPGTGWQALGACLGIDPDLFFPERGGDTATAKAICDGCPVRLDCLEYALTRNEYFGVWGGKSERERRRIRRKRRQLAGGAGPS